MSLNNSTTKQTIVNMMMKMKKNLNILLKMSVIKLTVLSDFYSKWSLCNYSVCELKELRQEFYIDTLLVGGATPYAQS